MSPLLIGALALVGLVVLVFALIGFLYLTRGTPVHHVTSWGDPDGSPKVCDERFRPTMELLTRTTLLPGHSISVSINGDQTYDRLWADLRSAEKSLTLQMYYFQPGKMAEQFKEIITERARAGVQVLLLHDAFGSQKLKQDDIDSLCDAGVRVSAFRPVKW